MAGPGASGGCPGRRKFGETQVLKRLLDGVFLASQPPILEVSTPRFEGVNFRPKRLGFFRGGGEVVAGPGGLGPRCWSWRGPGALAFSNDVRDDSTVGWWVHWSDHAIGSRHCPKNPAVGRPVLAHRWGSAMLRPGQQMVGKPRTVGGRVVPTT